MRSWLISWLPWRRNSTQPESDRGEPSAVPGWVEALQDRVQKVARAQSKLSLRLDEIVVLLEERRAPPPFPDPAPLLDALDRLDEARRALVIDKPGAERGLASIGARLEGLLAAVGVERRAEVGVPADPKPFRVVGVEPGPDVVEGVVTRVVRAAAVRGAPSQLIREGEVLVGRRSP